MKRVSYIFPTSHHYRLPFHERMRDLLALHDVEYVVVYCDPGEESRRKRDTVDVPWGIKVQRTTLPGGLLYQHGLGAALQSDLVIMQQESKLLLNYLLSIASRIRLKKVGYFGHGRNFQSRNPSGPAERFKQFWSTKVDWWFAYTDETRRHIESLNFPSERITVFNNAVDTTEVRTHVASVEPARLEERRTELKIRGEHVGVFVGGLYADKRLDFLVEAADRIRARLPNFELLVIGGGDQLPLMEAHAATRSWLKVLGPRFGSEKVELMMLAQLFLMPGLVGLAVVDAGAAGLPTATTAFPFHSPEIAYIQDGVNGLIVPDWQDAAAYADAVADLFERPEQLAAMQMAAAHTVETLTIEAMAERFVAGVLRALDT